MRITAQIRAMAEADVLQLVPERIMRDIKREDPNPLFKAFVIGHEGTAEPTIVGLGRTLQRWFTGAIQALAIKLREGVKVFKGHGATNDHGGRTPVGEVIAVTTERIKNALSAVAVAYIYPQFKGETFDVASVEADLMIPKDARDFEVNEPDVLGVSGIALGDSRKDRPAFPEATLLAELQAFADPPKGDNRMTLDEIKAAVREGKFSPSEIFPKDILAKDPLVSDVIEEKTHDVKGYHIRKLTDAEAQLNSLKEENATLKTQLGDLSKVTLKTKGRDIFDSILKDRKIDGDEKFKKFVSRAYDKGFDPTEEAKLKDDLNRFVDTQVDEFKDIFGEEVKVGQTSGGGGGNGADTNKGVGADDKGTPAGGGVDLLDPKNNELIPTD